MSGEWISRGTALSAPLIVLIALAIGLGLSRLSGRWGQIGAALTTVVAVLIVFAISGEPLVPAEAEAAAILLVAFRAAVYCSALAAAAWGVRLFLQLRSEHRVWARLASLREVT